MFQDGPNGTIMSTEVWAQAKLRAFNCSEAVYRTLKLSLTSNQSQLMQQETLHTLASNNLATHLVPFASLSVISGTCNSLFKVLFTFPSWYLFAIGLKSIFSFRWNLPPTLRSNSEERDSEKQHCTRWAAHDTQDSHPHWCSFPRGLHMHHR